MTTPLQFLIFLDDVEYAIEGDYSPGCPAQISGPWESCYPEEPPEFEITSIKLDGREIGLHEFTEEFNLRIQEASEEAAAKAYELLREKDLTDSYDSWRSE